jgi:hypothetical protein
MEVYCQEITAQTEKNLPKRSSILNLTPIWKDGLLRSNTRLRYLEDLSGDKISDHFTQETSSDKTHREVSPQK